MSKKPNNTPHDAPPSVQDICGIPIDHLVGCLSKNETNVKNEILGEVLTIVDVAIVDPQQNKAMKDSVKKAFWRKDSYKIIAEAIIKFLSNIERLPDYNEQAVMYEIYNLHESFVENEAVADMLNCFNYRKLHKDDDLICASSK